VTNLVKSHSATLKHLLIWAMSVSSAPRKLLRRWRESDVRFLAFVDLPDIKVVIPIWR